jgi:uncharacterized UPF0146 family protein
MKQSNWFQVPSSSHSVDIILAEINTKYTKDNSALITSDDFFTPLENYLYLTAMFGFQQ